MNRLALALLSASITFAAPAWAAPQDQNDDDPPSIIVLGEGKVSVKPTLATVEIGVATQAATAGKALAANSTAMNELMKTLTTQGIAEKDIQTSSFDVSPSYSSESNRAPRITGYSVRNTVSVRVHKTAQMGPVLDAVVASGANQVHSIRFSVEDPSKLLDDARKQAIEDGKRKAALYAQGAGVTLGKLLHVIEMGSNTPPRPMAMYRMAAAEMQSTPISTGEQELSVNITVVYAIQ